VFVQLHGELDELQRALNSRRGAYGNSLATVKMTLQAFRQFEKSVEPVEGKVRNFSNTADTLMRTRRGDDRRLRHDVDELKRKWNEFCKSIGDYRLALDESTKFFELMDNVSVRKCSMECESEAVGP
jgi:Spectrin repeat